MSAMYNYQELRREISKKTDNSTSHWRYPERDEPEIWKGVCSGTKQNQSPILLRKAYSVRSHFLPFELNNYWQRFHNYKLINTGHSVSIPIPTRAKITITGGPLWDKYALQDIHWHWNGTEHKMDCENGLILEMHLVHRNLKYPNKKIALQHRDGFAVLAVMFRKSFTCHPVIASIFKYCHEIKKPEAATFLPNSFHVRQLLPKDLSTYFTYNGSLTTPPCSEVVTWIVFRDPLEVSPQQIAQLQSVESLDGRKIKRNCRSIQPLHDRVVIFNA